MKVFMKTMNIFLALTIITLTIIIANTWIVPKYSDSVNLNVVAHEPKTLEPLILNRKGNNAKAVNAVVQGNMFRQDRREFNPPVQVRQMVPGSASPTLPPPDLKLNGVLLSGSKKIAFIEGNYPVRAGIQGNNKKLLDRKGYPLGAKIGDFELTEIKKTKVTLKNNKGVVLIFNLEQRPEEKIIQRIGNTLIQKDKSFDPESIKKVSPPRPSSKTTQKQPNPARIKGQARPSKESKELWTRFKREEGQARQE
jgi:hypothetical protein